jgi:hypothetical protein
MSARLQQTDRSREVSETVLQSGTVAAGQDLSNLPCSNRINMCNNVSIATNPTMQRQGT